jgi:hypothetical protein
MRQYVGVASMCSKDYKTRAAICQRLMPLSLMPGFSLFLHFIVTLPFRRVCAFDADIISPYSR